MRNLRVPLRLPEDLRLVEAAGKNWLQSFKSSKINNLQVLHKVSHNRCTVDMSINFRTFMVEVRGVEPAPEDHVSEETKYLSHLLRR
jgi:hypothetical protein